MKEIKFVEDIKTYDPKDAFIARLPTNINGKEDLLKELSAKLNFPDYFGFNWDALHECLRDFHWIEERNIILIHEELPLLDDRNMKIYLDILNDAVASWKEYSTQHLEVVFPADTKHLFLNQ
jgi:RNAse (barnase) inhibitor barstar